MLSCPYLQQAITFAFESLLQTGTGVNAKVKRRPHPRVPQQFQPVDIQVGVRLRLRRKRLGLSQDALGQSVGITFQQLQKYERGANRIGASRLYELSRKL